MFAHQDTVVTRLVNHWSRQVAATIFAPGRGQAPEYPCRTNKKSGSRQQATPRSVRGFVIVGDTVFYGGALNAVPSTDKSLGCKRLSHHYRKGLKCCSCRCATDFSSFPLQNRVRGSGEGSALQATPFRTPRKQTQYSARRDPEGHQHEQDEWIKSNEVNGKGAFLFELFDGLRLARERGKNPADIRGLLPF